MISALSKEKPLSNKEKKRFKLDNAATIYSAARSKDWNVTFRCSVILKKPVHPSILQQAVTDLHDRFPTIYVQLRRGAFWYYLEEVDGSHCVREETVTPCQAMEIGAEHLPLFRVLYYQNRVSVEMSHCLTDGNGALIYIKTLIARYLELLGCDVEKTHGVLDITEEPDVRELEDSYRRIATKEKGLTRKEPDAYQYEPKIEDNTIHVIHGLLPLDVLKQVTKPLGVTINEYLAAVYAYAFYLNLDPAQKKHKPIRISVPANLRSFFDSISLRNFAMVANVDIYPDEKEYTFDDVLKEISEKLRAGLQKEVMRRSVCKNIADEDMLISRLSPVFLKTPVMKKAFVTFGVKKQTTSFSNLGLVQVPAAMEPFIERFEFIIGRLPLNKINATACSFGKILNVTFSSTSPETVIQRTFFTQLTERGIPVQVTAN